MILVRQAPEVSRLDILHLTAHRFLIILVSEIYIAQKTILKGKVQSLDPEIWGKMWFTN